LKRDNYVENIISIVNPDSPGSYREDAHCVSNCMIWS